MKKNPLSKVVRHAKVKGTINNSTTGVDSFGNPTVGKTEVIFEILVFDLEGKSNLNYRGKYGVDPGKKIVKVYLDKYLNNYVFELLELDYVFSTIDNKATFTIVDKNQPNLMVISQIFGNHLICVFEGTI